MSVEASGGEDGMLRVWETHSGQRVTTLAGHAEAVTGAGLSRDGSLVASSGYDGAVRLWRGKRRVSRHTTARSSVRSACILQV
jgi:WD40 repeat protein